MVLFSLELFGGVLKPHIGLLMRSSWKGTHSSGCFLSCGCGGLWVTAFPGCCAGGRARDLPLTAGFQTPHQSVSWGLRCACWWQEARFSQSPRGCLSRIPKGKEGPQVRLGCSSARWWAGSGVQWGEPGAQIHLLNPGVSGEVSHPLWGLFSRQRDHVLGKWGPPFPEAPHLRSFQAPWHAVLVTEAAVPHSCSPPWRQPAGSHCLSRSALLQGPPQGQLLLGAFTRNLSLSLNSPTDAISVCNFALGSFMLLPVGGCFGERMRGSCVRCHWLSH